MQFERVYSSSFTEIVICSFKTWVHTECKQPAQTNLSVNMYWTSQTKLFYERQCC